MKEKDLEKLTKQLHADMEKAFMHNKVEVFVSIHVPGGERYNLMTARKKTLAIIQKDIQENLDK